MSTYSPNRVGLTDITVPADGEDVDAASVNVPIEALADGVLARTPSMTLSLSADAVRLMVGTGAGTASPALNALGTLVVPLSTEIENSDTQLGVIVTKTVNGMTSTMLLYIPLPEMLSFHGYTVASCVLKVLGKTGHAALPGGMPRIALVRFGASANTSLCSTTWNLDTAADAAAYEVEHDITITVDQNAVVDCSQYQYALLVQNEYGSNSLDTLQFRRIVLTFTAP